MILVLALRLDDKWLLPRAMKNGNMHLEVLTRSMIPLSSISSTSSTLALGMPHAAIQSLPRAG